MNTYKRVLPVGHCMPIAIQEGQTLYRVRFDWAAWGQNSEKLRQILGLSHNEWHLCQGAIENKPQLRDSACFGYADPTPLLEAAKKVGEIEFNFVVEIPELE